MKEKKNYDYKIIYVDSTTHSKLKLEAVKKGLTLTKFMSELGKTL